jgi:hypothetical protein
VTFALFFLVLGGLLALFVRFITRGWGDFDL